MNVFTDGSTPLLRVLSEAYDGEKCPRRVRGLGCYIIVESCWLLASSRCIYNIFWLMRRPDGRGWVDGQRPYNPTWSPRKLGWLTNVVFTFCDAGPTLKQHWFIVMCFLEGTLSIHGIPVLYLLIHNSHLLPHTTQNLVSLYPARTIRRSRVD